MMGKRSDPASMAEDWGRNRQAQGKNDAGRQRGEQGDGRGRGRSRGGMAAGGRGRGGAASTPTDRVSMRLTPPPTPSPTEATDAAGAAEKTQEDTAGTPVSPALASSSGPLPDVKGDGNVTVAQSEEKAQKPVLPPPIKRDATDGPDIRACRHFARTGKCTQGAKCKFSHEVRFLA